MVGAAELIKLLSCTQCKMKLALSTCVADMCVKMHILCKACYDSLPADKRCTVCSQELGRDAPKVSAETKEWIRSSTMRQADPYLAELKIRCPNHADGCALLFAAGDVALLSHTAECAFLKVPCEKECGARISPGDKESHLQTCTNNFGESRAAQENDSKISTLGAGSLNLMRHIRTHTGLR